MDGSMIRHTFLAASALAGACTVAACGSAAAAVHRPSTAPPAAARPAAAARSPMASLGPATRSPAAPTPMPRPRVRIIRVRTADGALVTAATFLGPVRYVLHNGSADPGPAASGLVRAGPAVTGVERRQLLAAFNGGFKLSAGAGGYMQEGHVISPLRPDLASLVIDRSGQARIGVWGAWAARAGRGRLQRPAELAAAGAERTADRGVGRLDAVGRDPRRRRVCGPQRDRPGRRGASDVRGEHVRRAR